MLSGKRKRNNETSRLTKLLVGVQFSFGSMNQALLPKQARGEECLLGWARFVQ